MTTRMLMFTLAALTACRETGTETSTKPASTDDKASATSTAALSPQDEVARGKHLVMVSACHDCHTPFKMGPSGPAPDFTRALSGHPSDVAMPPAPELPPGPWIGLIGATNTAWAGPWGTSFTANLTPDPETGMGTWSRQNFIDTIRNGRHMGAGRPLLPPMPAAMYANYSDEDLGAIYAYLRTLPPIKNQVPAPVPPRTAMAAPAEGTGQIATR